MINQIVQQALKNTPDFSVNADVVEKEIIHHDILRLFNDQGLFSRLTLIGGTGLRLCYNSSRLSEDLDFTAGTDFEPADLHGFEVELEKYLIEKYALNVKVREPQPSEKDTKTWKVTIEKHPDRPDMPSQRIHIDVCAYPSLDIQQLPVINHYSIPSPIEGMPIPVQSPTEILADKLIALAYRERRIKPRDVWDILWLDQRRDVRLDIGQIRQKLDLRDKKVDDFVEKLTERKLAILNDESVHKDFVAEMKRFVSEDLASRTLLHDEYWGYAQKQIKNKIELTQNELIDPSDEPAFRM